MEIRGRVDETVDASGLQCPLPLAKASKALSDLASGQVLKIISTDEGSLLDFQSWSQQNRMAELLRQETAEGADGRKRYVHYLMRR